MFDQKKNEAVDAKPAGEAGDQVTAAPPPPSKSSEAKVDLPPPPRASVSLPEKPSATVSLPEKPSRRPETPSRSGRRADKPGRDDGKELIVGREIVLKGGISSCDRLVVEGKVEAVMKDCREIEIAKTGTFKGQVEFDRADISGVFEGELTAREHLVVRSTGRISGKVKFGELEIERGGQVIGDIQVFGDGAAEGQAKDKPAK